jgi:hypothetical protein
MYYIINTCVLLYTGCFIYSAYVSLNPPLCLNLQIQHIVEPERLIKIANLFWIQISVFVLSVLLPTDVVNMVHRTVALKGAVAVALPVKRWLLTPELYVHSSVTSLVLHEVTLEEVDSEFIRFPPTNHHSTIVPLVSPPAPSGVNSPHGAPHSILKVGGGLLYDPAVGYLQILRGIMQPAEL